MRLSYKIVFLFSLMLIFSTTVGCSSSSAKSVQDIKNQGYISMSTHAAFKPFEFVENGDIIGIDIDIARKIADKLGVELKVNSVDFDKLIDQLKNNKSDFVISGMSYTDARAKDVDFSESYFNATQVMVVPKDSGVSTAIDLKGKRVGVQTGTTSDSYCTDSEKRGLIGETVRFNKSGDAISNMINGHLDAVVVDDFVADKFVEQYGNRIKKLSRELSGERYRITVSKGNEELLDVINGVIFELEATGELTQIAGKYISVE